MNRGVVWVVALIPACIAVGGVAAVVVVLLIFGAFAGAVIAARCAGRAPMSHRAFGLVFHEGVTLPKLPVAKRASHTSRGQRFHMHLSEGKFEVFSPLKCRLPAGHAIRPKCTFWSGIWKHFSFFRPSG